MRDNRRLCFYPAIFGQTSTVYDFLPGARERTQFKELVRPGAFTRSIVGGDVMANVDHDEARAFARQSTGLLLQEDAYGLFASVFLPQTALGDEIIAGVERGHISGGSFRSRLIPGGDVWTGDTLEVLDAPLVDVCITDTPAYSGTSVRVRTDKYVDLFRRLRLVKLR